MEESCPYLLLQPVPPPDMKECPIIGGWYVLSVLVWGTPIKESTPILPGVDSAICVQWGALSSQRISGSSLACGSESRGSPDGRQLLSALLISANQLRQVQVGSLLQVALLVDDLILEAVEMPAFPGGTLPCILLLYSLQSLLNRRIKDRNTSL